MRQQTLAGTGLERHRKMTRREWLLQEMDRIVPWQRLVAVVAPQNTTGERGRPPVGLERMLRVYCLGHWYNLYDPALQATLYAIEAMRRFVGTVISPSTTRTSCCSRSTTSSTGPQRSAHRGPTASSSA